MKPCMVLAFILSLFAGEVLSQNAVYSNIVGYQRLQVAPGEKVMASVPFTSESTNTVATLLDGQADPGNSPANADAVKIFDRVAETHRVYYPEVSAGVTNWSAGANLETLLPGNGFWFENNTGSTTDTVWLYGDVPTEASITVPIRPGLQMVHNPYPVPLQLSASTLTTLGHAALVKSQSDLVLQWNAGFGDYDTYWLFNDAGTRRWIRESADPTQTPAYADLTLNPGQAFWYQRKKDLPAFDWTVVKPYTTP